MWRALKVMIVVLVLSAAAPALAGQYEDGLAAYNKSDCATALRLWRPLAEHISPTCRQTEIF